MGVSRDTRPIWLVVVASDMVWAASRFGEKGCHDGSQASAMGTECCETHGKYLASLF